MVGISGDVAGKAKFGRIEAKADGAIIQLDAREALAELRADSSGLMVRV